MNISNNVSLIGNLGKDPEVRRLESGVAVAQFSIATNKVYTNKAGEKIQETQWHNLVLWNKVAEVAEQWLKKGQLIAVNGELVHRSYEKDGQTRYITEVVVDQLKMLGGGSGSPPPPPPPPSQNTGSDSGGQQQTTEYDDMPTDDLPF